MANKICECADNSCCDLDSKNKKWWKHKKGMGGSSGGHIYGLGLIGALFYFMPQVTNFQQGLMGILKAVVWPALLIFKAFELLRM